MKPENCQRLYSFQDVVDFLVNLYFDSPKNLSYEAVLFEYASFNWFVLAYHGGNFCKKPQRNENSVLIVSLDL